MQHGSRTEPSGAAHDGDAPRGRRKPAPGQYLLAPCGSTTGCGQRTRTFRSRGTRMISSRTCRTEMQAQQVLSHIKRRLAQSGWKYIRRRHASSTVRMTTGRAQVSHGQFTFLGYTFRARRSKNRWGKYFISFSPAVSNAARRGCGKRCDVGIFLGAATRPSTTWPACGVSFAGGFNTTAVSTNRPCIRSFATSMACWFDGPCGNTKG